jgi:hypothetical protein
MEFRCPYCHAPIYSRSHKICGVCEKPLPESLLLSDKQVAELKKEAAEEEKRAKEFNPHIHDSRVGGMGGLGML